MNLAFLHIHMTNPNYEKEKVNRDYNYKKKCIEHSSNKGSKAYTDTREFARKLSDAKRL